MKPVPKVIFNFYKQKFESLFRWSNILGSRNTPCEWFMPRPHWIHKRSAWSFNVLPLEFECNFSCLQRLTIPSTCPPTFASLLRKCWITDPRVSQWYIIWISLRRVKPKKSSHKTYLLTNLDRYSKVPPLRKSFHKNSLIGFLCENILL